VTFDNPDRNKKKKVEKKKRVVYKFFDEKKNRERENVGCRVDKPKMERVVKSGTRIGWFVGWMISCP